MKRSLLRTAVLVLVCLSVGIAMGSCTTRWIIAIESQRYDVTDPQDVARLRKLAYACSPVVDAVRRQTESGAPPPNALQDLPDLPAHFLHTFDPLLNYIRDGEDGAFQLRYKLNWDASLFYYHSDKEWIYDPGDGGDITVIEL